MKSNITDNQRKDLWNILQKAPKPQLHLHLDGSLSFGFIMESAKRFQVRKPEEQIIFEKNWKPQNEEELFQWLAQISSEDIEGHFEAKKSDNWRAFNFCNKFLQTEEDLIEATSNIVCRASVEHNINYIEIRFAPILHKLEGLTEKKAIFAVIRGFEKGVSNLKSLGKNIDGGLILCALRSFPVSDALNLVKLMTEIKHERVLAFDIAGDEGNYPLVNFKEVLQLAKDTNIKMTIHAGEWSENLYDSIIDNLKLAVDIGVQRIGHGLALRSVETNGEIMLNLKEKNISVEVNLTSNVTNQKNVSSFEEHPLPMFLERNIKIAGLNVDNWLLSGRREIGRAEPTGEYVRAFIDCGVTCDQLKLIAQTGFLAGFKKLKDKSVDELMNVWSKEIIPQLKAWEKNLVCNGLSVKTV